ncbi:dihydroxy-acid dehydratase, partial [Escherichia coli]|nr:dihydroxy-acid dehydratase [Escherichia coli]
PSAVLEAGWALLRSGEIWQHLAISGWRAAIGFLIGGAIGLVQDGDKVLIDIPNRSINLLVSDE